MTLARSETVPTSERGSRFAVDPQESRKKTGIKYAQFSLVGGNIAKVLSMVAASTGRNEDRKLAGLTSMIVALTKGYGAG